MSWMDEIGNILQRYTGGAAGTASAPTDVDQHFDQVARAAPQSVVADGLAESFRSNQTPPFDQMISNLFRNSGSEQKAGILNQLLGASGAGILSQIPGLSGLLQPGQQVTPERAELIPPDAVQQMAANAEKKNPSIVDQVSQFYAQHPDVVKALGGAALAIMIQRIARQERG
jgi:hypothetical protein